MFRSLAAVVHFVQMILELGKKIVLNKEDFFALLLRYHAFEILENVEILTYLSLYWLLEITILLFEAKHNYVFQL